MSKDFNFVEEDARRVPGQRRSGGIIGFLVRKGIAKTEAQANLYLIVLTVICIILIIYLNFF
ncbi:hypothetical protein K2Q16_00665 [Patescibacteria group bacterium]|nr:hypothetical protein [Patescibacteria group bacterium]